ncbi:NHL repeat-containing protein [Paenibacillus taihuensis]|uniref:NHL repeat-containing protein n=1 Tax=Paenibacillus taihuensis TaxID=1156355 RepID=A0A3D9Q200_9BACL|nr:hypothetical protein [Paenibacillus taihuensis]REE56450.1 NHL repeat-containing protein [Paenibacillus taihuensis]
MRTRAWLVLALTMTMCLARGSSAAAEEAPYQGYTYTEWGKPVPAPNGYLPDRIITGAATGAGDFKKPQSLFVNQAAQELYVADTGNNRIVVLDAKLGFKRELKLFTQNGSGNGNGNGNGNGSGKKQKLKSPTDVFVTPDGTLYIADNGNKRVVVSDAQGNILHLFGAPKSDLIPKGFVFQPEKLVVDSQGRLYIQAFGVFQGLICLDADGTFLNYFGGNRVEVTPKLLLELAWKKVLTKAQRNAMESFVPIEYSNMFIDKEDFIYTTVKTSQNSTDELKKLNPLGINILRADSSTGYVYENNDYGDHPVVYTGENGESKVDSMFVDITVDDDGFISALDASRGKVFQYDQESNLMFVFGGRGSQQGTFKNPVAVENFGGRLLVLDAEKNNITAFKLTSFGEDVRKAVKLYNGGFYKEDLEPWKEVLKRDSNYLLANVGLGKAYYQMGDYVNAMKYFKLGYDKKDYSDAFKAYYTDQLRAHFVEIFYGLAGLVILYQLFKRRKRIAAVYRRTRERGIPG